MTTPRRPNFSWYLLGALIAFGAATCRVLHELQPIFHLP